MNFLGNWKETYKNRLHTLKIAQIHFKIKQNIYISQSNFNVKLSASLLNYKISCLKIRNFTGTRQMV